MYSSDSKKAAQQFVRESLNQILAGTYLIPSLEEMISILESNYEYTFMDCGKRIIKFIPQLPIYTH